MVTDETELKTLMLRGLDGDADAARMLLTLLSKSLSVFFQRRLGASHADVEDLVQETLIAVHAKRATFDRSLPFTTWAYAIARYKLIDHFRRHGRKINLPLEAAGNLTAEGSAEDGVWRRDLLDMLDSLPVRQRALVEDVRLTGFTFAEAAARRGVSEGAARVSVHRSLKSLAAKVTGR